MAERIVDILSNGGSQIYQQVAQEVLKPLLEKQISDAKKLKY